LPSLFAGDISAAAQATGHFYLEKQIFARGEPVFLYYKITNRSTKVIGVNRSDPEQPMCWGVDIKVSSDPPSTTAACSILPDSWCVMNGQFGDAVPLSPGESTVERFLLNLHHQIVAPGSYWVEASQSGRLGDAAISAHRRLSFRIDASALFPRSRLQPWVDQLGSSDDDQRLEAARVLASVASTSVEDVLLTFAHDPLLKRYAPLALYRLNTQLSRVALAEMVRNSASGSHESLDAARYLAEIGGSYWYPLLLETAQRQPSFYLSFAAEAGGERIVPLLQSMAPGPDAHLEAIEALGWTASPKAIPILLDQLHNADQLTSNRAEEALQMLTHRVPRTESSNFHEAARYAQWSRWWQSEGAQRVIFKPTNCGAETPLPDTQTGSKRY